MTHLMREALIDDEMKHRSSPDEGRVIPGTYPPRRVYEDDWFILTEFGSIYWWCISAFSGQATLYRIIRPINFLWDTLIAEAVFVHDD